MHKYLYEVKDKVMQFQIIYLKNTIEFYVIVVNFCSQIGIMEQ